MARSIYRYEIPVHDQWHALDLTGDIVHIASRSVHTVELCDVLHVGTAIPPGGELVWHLIELP